MSNDPAIEVTGLGKCYQLYDHPLERLKQALWRGGRHREFRAITDISFRVNKGEAVGIIGRNGSGKSTLLQILAGTLKPTSGRVVVNGRVAALLELGSGFNPEFTGRENIFLNGAVLGLARREIEAKYDEIAAFADIGAFLEQPVKEYSSGMMMRLAFAVQVAINPEILIVDEALSVGDFFFQQKCFSRLRRMRENGLTLLFVSHDMGTVRDLCSRAVYLWKGTAAYVGDSQIAVHAYLTEQSSTAPAEPTAGVPALTPLPAATLDLAEMRRTALWYAPDDHENSHRLLAVRLLDQDGQPNAHVKMGDTIRIQVFFKTPPGETGHISLIIKNRFDQVVSTTGTYLLGLDACSSGDAQFAIAEFEVSLMLEAGLYSLMFTYGQPTRENQGKILGSSGWIGPLYIEWDYQTKRAPFLGMFGLPVGAKLIYSKERAI